MGENGIEHTTLTKQIRTAVKWTPQAISLADLRDAQTASCRRVIERAWIMAGLGDLYSWHYYTL